MSYPDVVIAYASGVWKHSSIEDALVAYDNNMKDYSWWLTDPPLTANHSSYLVCDRANTQSVTVRKVVKLQLRYCNALVIK